MNKEELLKLRTEKQEELNKIDKKLDEIYNEEFIKSKNYIGKFYNINNSNIYFHVTGFNPNKGVLFGSEIYFSPQDLSVTEEQIQEINNNNYTEISKDNMEKYIREQIEYLVNNFMNS